MEDNRQTKFVEFIGLPGSGKTTIASELVVSLQAGGFIVAFPDSLFKTHIQNKLTILFWVVSCICRHPVIVFQMFCIGLANKDLLFAKKLVRNTISVYKVSKKEAPYTIFDQGVLNACLYVDNTTRTFRSICTMYQKIFGTIPNIVLTEVDMSTAIYRATSRPPKGHFTEYQSEAYVNAVYNTYVSNMNKLKTYIQENQNMASLICINSTEDAQKNSVAIMKELV